MLWNGNTSYIFMPRTASRSLNAHFAETWQGPLFGTASLAQLREIRARSSAPVFVSHGRGHDNLFQLRDQLYRHGRTLQQMDRILFVVRNPYRLVLSNYYFLRDQAAAGSNSESALMAAQSTFDDFCINFKHPDPANWLQMDGKILPNMYIIRFEALAEDILKFDEISGSEQKSLPHLNRSKDDRKKNIIFSERSERIIYDQYRLMFDIGYYSRREGL